MNQKIMSIVLGGCPRIEIFSQIEAFFENKHTPRALPAGRNMHLVFRALFSKNNTELGEKGIL
jgi:hypothetical protein